MPSSFSASLRFELQFPGENINLWGNYLDATLQRIDDSIAGFVALTIPATGNYTLSSANSNATADEARRAHLKLTGSPAASFQVIIPAVSKSYWIWNATAYTATVTTGSGATSTVEAGDVLQVWCDGTNVKSTTYGGYNLKDYIASMTATAGAVPGTTGNLGKFLKVTVDGGPSTWQALASADITDLDAYVRQKTLVYSLIFGGG